MILLGEVIGLLGHGELLEEINHWSRLYKLVAWGCRDGPVSKSTCCSCKRHRLNSRHPQSGSQSSAIPVSGHFIPSIDQACTEHIHTCRQNTHIYKINLKKYLKGFITSPHFWFVLCFLCAIEMWNLRFLFLLPHLPAMTAFPSTTLSQNKLFLYKSLFVMAFYHSHRKAANTETDVRVGSKDNEL